MKKLLAVLLVIAAFCAIAIYTLPSTLTKASQKILSEVLQTEVIVKGVELSAINGTFSVAEVAVKDYPKFSNDNMFVMKNLTFMVDSKSLMSNVITVKELSVADLELNLTGGIKNNSLKELQHVISLREQFEAQEQAEHMASQTSHDGHNHKTQELKLKINEFKVGQIALSAKITDPIELPKKQLTIPGLKVKNIGGEEGLNVHNTVKTIVEDIDMVVTHKIADVLPAQKVYEEAKESLDKGVEKSKEFIEETFTEENLEKGKQKADQLMNKYFK